MVESECGLILDIAAALISVAFLLNQKLPSLASALLLRDVILVLVICPSILTVARAKFSLTPCEFRLTGNASFFHMIFKMGCKHIT